MHVPLDPGCKPAEANDDQGSKLTRYGGRRLAALVALALLAMALPVGDASAVQIATEESEPTVSDEIERPIPENAIPAGDDLYMVPLGKDGDGCEQFSLFSPTKMVATVIYYRAKDGGFTTDKQKADCG